MPLNPVDCMSLNVGQPMSASAQLVLSATTLPVTDDQTAANACATLDTVPQVYISLPCPMCASTQKHMPSILNSSGTSVSVTDQRECIKNPDKRRFVATNPLFSYRRHKKCAHTHKEQMFYEGPLKRFSGKLSVHDLPSHIDEFVWRQQHHLSPTLFLDMLEL